MDKKVVTRFAPSPTGKAHAGGYRTAMYAWLFAHQNNGEFILRIEDTDRARNSEEAREDIFEALAWLGITHDRMYIQSENMHRHKEILTQFIKEDKAFISREEAKDGGGEMKDIIRFRNPNKKITFTDLIRGEITIDTTDLGDFVIARSIDDPVYHLAVIVDDHDEGVTHVIRAEEHISNTPRHILLYEALGWEIPQYAHLPLVLTIDKKKLSKRKGALAMTDYAKMGYLPEAVFNCISMLGWNPADPGSEQEIFSIPELIKRFDFGRMQKSGAVFKQEKLDWFNRQYIKNLSHEDFWAHVLPYLANSRWSFNEHKQTYHSLENILREKITVFADVEKMLADGELDYFFEAPKIDSNMLPWKTLRNTEEGIKKTKENLKEVQFKLLDLSEEDWVGEKIKETIWSLTKHAGAGEVLWPLRVSLSGKEKSSDPFEIASIIGKQETLARITNAIAVCE
jgi:glutamyl-tRNA synthetase